MRRTRILGVVVAVVFVWAVTRSKPRSENERVVRPRDVVATSAKGGDPIDPYDERECMHACMHAYFIHCMHIRLGCGVTP